MASNNQITQKICFIKDAEQLIGRNRLTLRRWWKKNIFPKPALINNRLAWKADIINAWINLNVQEVKTNEEQTHK
jgi:predicted DNA-binding transcriptional regulator AlpA